MRWINKPWIDGFGRDAVWMAPLTNTSVALLIALAVLPVSMFYPRQARRLTVAGCCAVGALGLVLYVPSLGAVASLLLATGIGVALERWLNAHEQLARRLSTAVIPVAIPVLVALIASTRLRIGSDGPLEAAAPAPASAPNFLMIVMDTVRADHLSVYGYNRDTTPELAHFAARGTVFTNAFSAAPWTLPSHAALFTGHYAHQLSTSWTVPLDKTYRTLAEAFRARGYRTGGFVGNLEYCSLGSGLARGFDHYEGYMITPGQFVMSWGLGRRAVEFAYRHSLLVGTDYPNRKTAQQVINPFLSWVDEGRGTRRPFFAFLNFYDAHSPYVPSAGLQPWKSSRPAERENIDHTPWFHWTPEHARAEMDAYDDSLVELDAQIGRLIAALSKRGLLQNTVVVITADHGEEFLEHGLMDHGNSLYLAAVHVPLIMAGPGIPVATRRSDVVSLCDVGATILSVAGGNTSVSVAGSSLLRDGHAMRGRRAITSVRYCPNLPPSFPVSHGDMAAVAWDDNYYIIDGAGHESLYSIKAGASSVDDRAGPPPGRRICQEARRLLVAAGVQIAVSAPAAAPQLNMEGPN